MEDALGTAGNDPGPRAVPRRPPFDDAARVAGACLLVLDWARAAIRAAIRSFRWPGLVLIVWGFAHYRAAGQIEIWWPPAAFKHITEALMLPAVILVVASYIRGRIYATLKHPMLVGIKLWAAAHLIANGDLGSIILFGSFLAWAVFDRITLEASGRWRRTADFGRRPRSMMPIAIVVGIVAYLALGFVFHPVVIGVPVFGA